jgi:type I restriction enzyme S subunit
MTRTVLFGDVADLIKDSWKPNPSENLKYIGLEHINQQSLSLNGVGESISLESNKYKFKSGDILFGKLRPYFRKVYRPNFDGVCSTDIWVIRPKNGIDPDFLFYLIASKEFIDSSSGASTGTRMPRADWSHVSSKRWHISEDTEEIGKILKSLDEKIELNRRMNGTLEKIGQALFKHYFMDNPEAKTWPKGKIADLGEVITGKTPSKANKDFYGDNVLFLKVPDMHSQHIIIATSDHLSELGAESQNKKYIPKWSTCVSCIATVGVVSLAGETLQTNQQINSIIPKNKNYRFYNYFVMREKAELIKTMASGGTATPNLNKGQFANLKVTLPPERELTKFDQISASLFERILCGALEMRSLIALRDSLLPRLISEKTKI